MKAGTAGTLLSKTQETLSLLESTKNMKIMKDTKITRSIMSRLTEVHTDSLARTSRVTF